MNKITIKLHYHTNAKKKTYLHNPQSSAHFSQKLQEDPPPAERLVEKHDDLDPCKS
jgi:hypothetical protein